ncbi:hypothetical protein MESS4_480004 [Mesorhizobium sp. STM 4661]|nr:hypothetical protein MESS4_480004 [Mesorhizobium sp. STM 4661]
MLFRLSPPRPCVSIKQTRTASLPRWSLRADTASLANKVVTMQGSTHRRLRVGDFRVIFEETATEVIVTKIGPRGSVYDWRNTPRGKTHEQEHDLSGDAGRRGTRRVAPSRL